MPFRHFIHTSDKPGSCRLHAYSLPSRPHHRSHVSLSWALPQAFASWEIPRPPAHAADDLLHRGGERWRRYAVPAGRWLVTVGPCCPPGPQRGAHHGRRSPWPRDRVLLDPGSQPALAGRSSRRESSTCEYTTLRNTNAGENSRALG